MEKYKIDDNDTLFHDVVIHLINGEKIKALEEVYIPVHSTIFHGFRNDGSDTLKVTLGPDSEAIIPKKNILYITTENERRGYEIWK